MAKKKETAEGKDAPKKEVKKKAPAKTAAKAEAKSAAAKLSTAKPSSAKSSTTKTSKKSAPATAPSVAPLIDTSLAAEAAAKMIANKALLDASNLEKESGNFKQLKDSINKSSSAGIGNLLGSNPSQKKSNLPFGGGKQVGHNQTIGGFDRRNVPRRTGG